MSTINVETVKSKASATPPVFHDSVGNEIGQLVTSWAYIDGTGTPSVVASFNVSSVTDNGTGNYTANFLNDLSNANYSLLAFCSFHDGTSPQGAVGRETDGIKTVSAVQVWTHNVLAASMNLIDVPEVYIATVGGL